MSDFILRPEVQLIHVVRLCILSGSIKVDHKPWQGYTIDAWAHQLLDLYRKEKMPDLDLRTLAAVFTAVGLEERLLAEDVLLASQWLPGFQWESDAIWPFFAERQHILQEAFELQSSADRILSYWQKDIRRNAFNVLAAFPQLPDQFAFMLWELALGTNTSERYAAQACLSTYPDKDLRIVTALADDKKDVRAAATEWLGNLNATNTVPHIKNALEKEKYEDAKGTMMQALEKLGVPMEQFVNRNRLEEEAAKGLKKGIPAKLQWFPFDRLPGVHWEKTDAKVAPEIVHWFLIQAFTRKNPAPGPLLRLYCSYF